jgi:hypothetical protein
MFYATQLIGPIAAFVARICKEGKTSNIDFASNAVDIDVCRFLIFIDHVA